MSFLNVLFKKRRNFKKLLHECLDDILLYVKNESQHHNLDEILEWIGHNLNSAGIGVVISIIDNTKNNIYFRYVSTTEDIIDLAVRRWGKISMNNLLEYSKVLKNKQPLFCANRLAQLLKHSQLSAMLDAKLVPININSIILPLIIENEIIGFFEIFSENLKEENIKIAENFSQELSLKLAQTILYKEAITAGKNLEKLSELNQVILDHAPVSIITIDCAGDITSANKCFHEFSGSKIFLNKNIFKTDFFIREKLVDGYKKLLLTGQPLRKDDCYAKNHKNETKYLNIIGVPMRNKTGKIIGAISMAIENTKARQANEELKKLNKQLEKKVIERTRQLDIINKKLEEALKLKSKFIADASHELRTPLTIIQGNLDLRIKELILHNEKIPEVIGLIDKEIKHLSGIISDLTALTNADQNNLPEIYEKVDLNSVISDVVLSLEILARNKNIILIFKEDSEKYEIMGDEIRLEKLFLNLVNNALKYSDNGGRIKIRLEKNNQEIKIYIEDNGIGIPKKDLPLIFERFYRVNKARSRSEGGSGLGLSICQWIVNDHHGKIEVLSKLNKGTTFIINLPIDYKNIN